MHLFRLKEKLASAGLIRSREGSLDKKNNKFVSAQPVKNVQNNNIIGLEYHENVRTDGDYVQKVFETSSYQESHKLADCPYIKMPGCFEHHTYVGTYPAFTSAFSNTSGRALEHTLGIYVADKLKSKTQDREGLRQEDFYLTKLKWLIRMAKGELQSSKCNLNNLRMSIEKIMEEAAPAFDYELFQDQKKALKILKKLTYFLLKVEPQKAILLSYKLFKMRIKQLDLQDPQSRLEVANKLHTFFIPYVKLLEIKDVSRLGMLQKRKDNLATYYKTKSLCAMPEIASILKEYPDKKQSPTYTSKFRAFLGERITLDKALADLVPKSMRISTAESSVAESSDIGVGSLDNLDQVPAEMMASQGLGYENAKSIELDELNEVPAIGVKNYNFLGKRDQQEENSTPIKIVDSSLDSFRGRITPVLTPIKAKELNLSTDKSNMDSEINELMNDPELYRPTEEIKGSKEGTPSHFQRSAMKKKSTVTPLPANMLTSEQHPHKHVTINKVFDTSYDEINIATDPTRTSYKPDMIRVNSSNVLTRETQPPMRESIFRSQNRKPSVFQKDRIIKDTKKEMIYQKVLSIASDNVSKWDNIVNNPTIKIDKIKPENSPVVLLRAWALIEGFTPKEVFDQIFDTTQRCKWDTVTTDLQVVETLENNSEVIYFYIKTPFGITERDFVQRRDYIFDYPEKDSIVVSFQSCSHPAKPPLKKRIRGETHIAGYVIKPSATRPNSTDLCILSQVDIKGQVPKAIVNMVAGKAPAEWVNKLKKACENARSKK